VVNLRRGTMVTRRHIFAVGALALALLLATAPAGAHHKSGHDGGGKAKAEKDRDAAHPSGKDRSVEPGGSGTQGRSESDPDDDGHGPDRSNGGPDKPGGSGGVDLSDQDGNNGCGNDDDFEDDNEGWCGKPPKPEAATTEGVVSAAQPTRERPVLARRGATSGESSERPGATGVGGPRSEVLGSRVVRGETGATLPFTGSDVMVFGLVGLAFTAGGALLLRARH
jgi:hypothetical protein